MLNRANKIKNQATELEFVLRLNEDEDFIIIKSSEAEPGLRLAYRFRNETIWSPFENEIYEDFYKYMFLRISRLSRSDEAIINITLTNWLLGLWMI